MYVNLERSQEVEFEQLGLYTMIVKLIQSASELYEDHNLKEKYR